MKQFSLCEFVKESNLIEGILRSPTKREIAAHQTVLNATTLDQEVVIKFVGLVQPDAKLRSEEGMNVRVGNWVAPAGGKDVVDQFVKLLKLKFILTPFEFHTKYLTLHPFMDGNGRSARAIWLWQVMHAINNNDAATLTRLGFLHTFYYQTLAAHDEGSK